MSESYRPPNSSCEPATKKSRGFRLRDLFVVIAIIALLVAFFLPATRTAREAARRMQCSNNLKHIGLALHNYQEVYGTLPPAYLPDAEGRPMHSWRVLILPYLEQKSLYEKYRFDEPWNGPNNRQLMNQIPAVFRCPSVARERVGSRAKEEDHAVLTHYVVIADDKTPFQLSHAMATNEIDDGAENTLLVVELASECVPWMAPRDIDVAGFARVLSNKSQKQHTGGLNAAMADGSVRFINDATPPETLQALATATGGEKPPKF